VVKKWLKRSKKNYADMGMQKDYIKFDKNIQLKLSGSRLKFKGQLVGWLVAGWLFIYSQHSI